MLHGALVVAHERAEQGQFDGWLDVNGRPYSRDVKFTERFTRPTFGRLTIDIMVDDLKAYTKPFSALIHAMSPFLSGGIASPSADGYPAVGAGVLCSMK